MAENVKEKKKFRAKINAVLPGATIEKATTGEIEEVKKEIDNFIQEKPQDKNVDKKVHAIRDELIAKAYGMSKTELNKLRKEFKELESKQSGVGAKQSEQKQKMANIRNYKTIADTSKEEETFSKWHTGRSTFQMGTSAVAGIAASVTILGALSALIPGAPVVAGAVTGSSILASVSTGVLKLGTAAAGGLAAAKFAKQGLNKTSQITAKEEVFRAKYFENLSEIMAKVKEIDKELQENMETYKVQAEKMSEVEFRAYLIDELTKIFEQHGIYLDNNEKAQSEGSLEPCAMGG